MGGVNGGGDFFILFKVKVINMFYLLDAPSPPPWGGGGGGLSLFLIPLSFLVSLSIWPTGSFTDAGSNLKLTQKERGIEGLEFSNICSRIIFLTYTKFDIKFCICKKYKSLAYMWNFKPPKNPEGRFERSPHFITGLFFCLLLFYFFLRISKICPTGKTLTLGQILRNTEKKNKKSASSPPAIDRRIIIYTRELYPSTQCGLLTIVR